MKHLSKLDIGIIQFFFHKVNIVVLASNLIHCVLHLTTESVQMYRIDQLLLLVLLQLLNCSLLLILLV